MLTIAGIFANKRNKFIFFATVFIITFFFKISYVTFTNNWTGGKAADSNSLIHLSDDILNRGIFFNDTHNDMSLYPGFAVYLSMLRKIFGDDLLFKHRSLFVYIRIDNSFFAVNNLLESFCAYRIVIYTAFYCFSYMSCKSL